MWEKLKTYTFLTTDAVREKLADIHESAQHIYNNLDTWENYKSRISEAGSLAKDSVAYVKNQFTKTGLEILLIEALADSEEPVQLNVYEKIAFRSQYDDDSQVIFSYLWDALDSDQWKVVLKGLCLIYHLLVAGHEYFVHDLIKQKYRIQILGEYYNKDSQGMLMVRQKVRQIFELISDDSTLMRERDFKRALRQRITGMTSGLNDNSYQQPNIPQQPPPRQHTEYYHTNNRIQQNGSFWQQSGDIRLIKKQAVRNTFYQWNGEPGLNMQQEQAEFPDIFAGLAVKSGGKQVDGNLIEMEDMGGQEKRQAGQMPLIDTKSSDPIEQLLQCSGFSDIFQMYESNVEAPIQEKEEKEEKLVDLEEEKIDPSQELLQADIKFEQQFRNADKIHFQEVNMEQQDHQLKFNRNFSNFYKQMLNFNIINCAEFDFIILCLSIFIIQSTLIGLITTNIAKQLIFSYKNKYHQPLISMSIPTDNNLESMILHYNRLASQHLQQEQYKSALDVLQRANNLINSNPKAQELNKLSALTYNNLGCLYKRLKNYPLSIQYLQKAINQCSPHKSDYPNLASTHLNLCTIKSQLNNHEQALSHALNAAELIQTADPQFQNPDFLTTYIVSYQNAALEYEYMNQPSLALQIYRRMLTFSKKRLGTGHPIYKTLAQNCQVLAAKSTRSQKARTPKVKSERMPGIRSGSSGTNHETGKLPSIAVHPRLNRSLDQVSREKRRKDITPPPKPQKLQPIAYKVAPPNQRKFLSLDKTSASDLDLFTQKLSNLHSRLSEFEKEYQKLKSLPGTLRKTPGPKLDYTNAAVTIQKYWRGYRARAHAAAIFNQRRQSSNKKALEAIEELEKLQVAAIRDRL